MDRVVGIDQKSRKVKPRPKLRSLKDWTGKIRPGEPETRKIKPEDGGVQEIRENCALGSPPLECSPKDKDDPWLFSYAPPAP